MRRVLPACLLVALTVACRLGTDAPPSALPSAPVHLVVTPESLVFRGRAGDTILPDQYLSLSNDADAPGRWAAMKDGSWFLLERDGDALPYFLPVGPRPAGYAAGTYAASIWVVASGDTIRVPVILILATQASLSGRWMAAPEDSTRVALNLTDSGGAITGWGATGSPLRDVRVAGARSDTTVSLTLTATDVTFQFTGLLVTDRLLAGTLSGGGATVSLSLFRQ